MTSYNVASWKVFLGKQCRGGPCVVEALGKDVILGRLIFEQRGEVLATSDLTKKAFKVLFLHNQNRNLSMLHRHKQHGQHFQRQLLYRPGIWQERQKEITTER